MEPDGRPRSVAELRALAREHTTRAIGVLVECLGESDAKIRIQAANALLDRGWGKPTQVVSGEDGGPIRVDASADAALVAMLARLAK